VPSPSQRPPPIIPLSQPLPPPVISRPQQQPPPPIIPLSQPLPPPVIPRPQQQPPPPIIPPSQQPSLPSIPQPSTIAPMVNSDNIKADTLVKYQKLQSEAHQYETRYNTVDDKRKSLLRSRINDLINKIREDTFDTLTKDLFEFLNGRQQQVSSQMIRVSNDEGND
jgi:hypothetical protein